MKQTTPAIFALLVFVALFSPICIYAQSMKISSLSTATVQAGDTLKIFGTNLQQNGSSSCTYYKPGEKVITWGTCSYKLTVTMMKQAQAPCARPLAHLPIVSSNSTELTVSIPKSLEDGDGDWYLTLGGVDSNGDTFMVGGEKLIRVTGSTRSEYNCVGKDGKTVGSSSKPTISSTPSITPTISLPASSPTPKPLFGKKNDDISDSRYSYAILSFIGNIIAAPFRFFLKIISPVSR